MTLVDINNYFDDIDPTFFQYWCCQDEAPTLAEVEAFQAETGFDLPDDFREFLTSRLGGLHVEVPQEVWPRRKGGAFWWFLYGISVFGLGPKIPEWLDLRVQHRHFQVDGFGDLMPFMRVVSDPDRYCFARSGQIVRWSHESASSMSVDESFAELLMRELHALEARKDRVVSKGLTP